MGIFNKFKYMCKYKVQEKAKLNLLDIINILKYIILNALLLYFSILNCSTCV